MTAAVPVVVAKPFAVIQVDRTSRRDTETWQTPHARPRRGTPSAIYSEAPVGVAWREPHHACQGSRGNALETMYGKPCLALKQWSDVKRAKGVKRRLLLESLAGE